jgi:hypothetical protein
VSSPFLELLALAQGERVQPRALTELVHGLAAQRRVDSDIAQEVLVRLITRPEHRLDSLMAEHPALSPLLSDTSDGALVAHADRVLRAYLRVAVKNQHLDQIRRESTRRKYEEKRAVRDVSDGEAVTVRAGADGSRTWTQSFRPSHEHGGATVASTFERAIELLGQAREHVVASARSAEDGARFSEDVEQVIGLNTGAVTMNGILAAERRGDESRETTRTRVLRRHSRIRDRIRESIEALRLAGEIDAEDAALAQNAVQHLLVRCQTHDAARVSKTEES